MNEATQVKMATPEEQENFKGVCDHIGTHGPCAQNVVINTNEILIITSHACMNCGKLFTNINPVPLMPEKSNGIVAPKPKGILS